ncbi:MAG: diguanylate cyclase [Deltaproteobacteria bacterium]|nr:diguanylate cyclase [Deltaproteobacteria bacterium]
MLPTDIRVPEAHAQLAVLPASGEPWIAGLAAALAERGYTTRTEAAGDIAFHAFIEGAAIVVWRLEDGLDLAEAWLRMCERAPRRMPAVAVLMPDSSPEDVEACLAAGFDEVFSLRSDPARAAARLIGRARSRDVHHSLAAIDPLTSLVTRGVFFSRLDPTVRLSSRAGMPMAVAVLDLDGFRALEQRVGRDVVRDLLRDVADHLRRVLRRSDTVARLGDDRFGLILHHITAFEARKLVYQIWRSLTVRPETLERIGPGAGRITFTAGVAVFPGDSADGRELYTRAEIALDVARASGHRRVLLYSETAGDAGMGSTGSSDLRYHRTGVGGREDPE